MRKAVELAAVAVLGLALLWTMRGRMAGYPYGYDEADYLLTAERGFLAHWWDSPSLTLPEFVRLGRSGSERRALSDMVRERGFVDFYRHWHGPLYFYWMMNLDASCERCARWVSLVFHFAAYLVVYAGVSALAGIPAGLAAAVGYWISFTNLQTAIQLIPHSLFTLCYITSLLAMAWWLKSGRAWAWYTAVVFAALAFCTLEVALILIATLAATAWLGRERFTRAMALRSVGVFVTTVLVVWPAGLLKLSFVKAYIFMAYLALFRKAAWGTENVAGSWVGRILASPVEWALLLAGVALVAWKWRRWRELLPLAVFGVLMIGAVGKVAADEQLFLVPRYQAPYLTALLVLGVACVVKLFEGARAWAAAAVLMALLGWNAARQYAENPVPSYFPWLQVVAGLKQQSLDGKMVLAPAGATPVMRYYLRGIRWAPYESDAALEQEIARMHPDGFVRLEGGPFEAKYPKVVTLTKAYSGERMFFHDLREAAR